MGGLGGEGGYFVPPPFADARAGEVRRAGRKATLATLATHDDGDKYPTAASRAPPQPR